MTRIRVFAATILVLVLCAGRAHAQAKAVLVVPTAGPLAGQTLYHASYALIIGINRYRDLPAENALNYAVKDAVDLRYLLIRRYGFPAGHVTLLTDDQATKAAIESALSDLADSDRITPDDRVLVFFSGHGQTVPTAVGGEQGFLLPSDADVDLAHPDNAGPYLKSCIQMATLWAYLDSCPAKHVLVIADACYSGLLAQERSVGEISPKVLARMAALRARQVITAGTKGETSLEVSSLGHGLLTYSLLEQLRGRVSDLGQAFTASDLFLQVRSSVRDYSQGNQIPQLASHDAEGDFIFIPTAAQPVSDVPAGSNAIPEPRPTSAAPKTALDLPPAPIVPPVPVPMPAPPFPSSAPPRVLTPEEQARANAALVGLWAPDGILINKRAGLVTVDAVRQALDAGADPDARNSDWNETTLCYAAHNGLKDVARLLIEQGARLDSTNKGDTTPLMEAAICDEVPVAQLLIEKGAQVNYRNLLGKSPLMTAASFCRADFVQFLLNNGAKINDRDVEGRTALDYAETPTTFYGQPASAQAQADTGLVLKKNGAVE